MKLHSDDREVRMSIPQRVKPNHKAIEDYYAKLDEMRAQKARHEGAVSMAFYQLLNDTAGSVGWSVVSQQTIKANGKLIRPEAILRDEWRLPHGYWEAKDTDDDLDREIANKKAAGYPLRNTIFEDTREAVLYQNGVEVLRIDMQQPDKLARLLNWFYAYEAPDFEQFEKAVEHFQGIIPELAEGLDKRIKQAHKENDTFQKAYDNFFEIARTSLNPNLSRDAVDEMLIQHLLTERVIRTVFDNPDFVNRNVIAREIEKVINALTSRHFNRHEFLGALDRFYRAIEDAADDLADFGEKQHFLNTVYERFFQGYSVEIADTHGIVYTPQEIVDFMCAAVEEVLRDEFGLGLGDEGVNVLDPATGTGNFIVNLMRRIPVHKLEHAYREQLFANEVMLMPYYIASLNIEHEYYDLTGHYEPFEGICFVDTLDLAEGAQMRMSFVTEANTARVEKQKNTPITVIIGNPPYNVGQINENDNNKNRGYDVIDGRIAETYVKDSAATLKMQLYDAYVRFFRWATDRLGDRDGVVCYITNNSFVSQLSFDGMRKHLLEDYSEIYHIDLHGNVRQNPKLSGTTHNVFGIQVGVGITIAIRKQSQTEPILKYHRVPEFWKKEEKLAWLEKQTRDNRTILDADYWQELKPDKRHSWLVPEHAHAFESFIPVGDKETKGDRDTETIFRTYGAGIKTNRDSTVYDFNRDDLAARITKFIEAYNSELDRYKRTGATANVDDFVNPDKLKWDGTLKGHLESLREVEAFNDTLIRQSLYRPFTKKYLYFDSMLINSVYRMPYFFPTETTEEENRTIVLSDLAYRANTPSALITKRISDIHLCASSDAHQTFPFYVYADDGTNRRENITDWALEQFREHYADDSISKWDVFYYVYGLLHHPGYREKYADNLKRDLPHIPFAPDFRAFSEAGRALAQWHLDYEDVEPYKLDMQVKEGAKPHARPGGMYHVEKMRRSKDGARVKVNEWLTLAGIPPEVDGYMLGNRSAVDWVIDQYRIKTDWRTDITHDPNDPANPTYIIDLLGKVVRVSVETVRIVDGLPEDFGG